MLANAYVEGSQIKITAWFLTPHTIATCSAGDTTADVADADGFLNGQSVLLEGASMAGRHHVTTIAAPPAGNVITLAAAPLTSVKWAAFGKLSDPSAITFKVERPDGTLVTWTHPDAAIATPQAGIYVLTYDPPVSGDGTYNYRVEGTGNAKGAAEGSFVLRSSRIV